MAVPAESALQNDATQAKASPHLISRGVRCASRPSATWFCRRGFMTWSMVAALP